MIYDEEANILCWEVAKGKINHAVEVSNFIIHLSQANKPVLIEVLDASKFFGQFNKIKNIKELKRIIPVG